VSHGRWFDGRTAAEHSVEVTLNADRIELREADDARLIAVWPLDRVRIVAHGPPLALTKNERPDERLYIADPIAIGAALASIHPHPANRGILDQRPLHRLMVALSAMAAALIAALIVIPRTTNLVPWLLPDSAKVRLGREVVDLVTGNMRRCDDAAGSAAIADLGRRLAGTVRVNVTVVDHPAIDAFAAPGGEIGLFRGLIANATGPNALAAVLAHEIAHEIHGHGLKRVTSSLGLGALASAVFGGGSTLFRETAELAILFAFSRDDEREADVTALDLLQRAAIDPAGLTALFAVIEEGERDTSLRIPSYFSTHPPTPERRAAAEVATGHGSGYSEALDQRRWAAVKAICD
jgi:predicted Zn-dependent protease